MKVELVKVESEQLFILRILKPNALVYVSNRHLSSYFLHLWNLVRPFELEPLLSLLL